MSAFTFIISSWRYRGTGHTSAERPTTAVDTAPASPTAKATTVVGDQPVRSRPDDVDRPMLRRPRRYRSDGVLGMRWLG
jgi:hypothetical protein